MEGGRCLLDLRTVSPEDDELLAAALLFGQPVRPHAGKPVQQSRFAVIHVPGGG
ncbi:hypothetical protein MAHJHV63_49980 [Mycobacterium avium subsp. hominissuis]